MPAAFVLKNGKPARIQRLSVLRACPQGIEFGQVDQNDRIDQIGKIDRLGQIGRID